MERANERRGGYRVKILHKASQQEMQRASFQSCLSPALTLNIHEFIVIKTHGRFFSPT